jgi:hypothetical protein
MNFKKALPLVIAASLALPLSAMAQGYGQSQNGNGPNPRTAVVNQSGYVVDSQTQQRIKDTNGNYIQIRKGNNAMSSNGSYPMSGPHRTGSRNSSNEGQGPYSSNAIVATDDSSN